MLELGKYDGAKNVFIWVQIWENWNEWKEWKW